MIVDGRYSNISDYIRDLIRRDQERKGAIAQLQAEITKGIESGPPEPFDVVSFKLKMRENGQAILNRIMQ
jgi:antitoxin ParD1/3/4